LAVEIQGIRESLIASRNRGVRTKFITEITKDNISYCKRLIPLVDELRHVDGVKGSFYLNEIQYLAPAALHDKGKLASEIICSNVKELLEHQEYL
jgi:two-component system, OmpR family, sensor histidine kinase VicK